MLKRTTSSVLKVLASLSLMENWMRSQWLGIHMVLQTMEATYCPLKLILF